VESAARPFLDPVSLYKRKLKTLSLVGGQNEPK